jgi:hypothetical protein
VMHLRVSSAESHQLDIDNGTPRLEKG